MCLLCVEVAKETMKPDDFWRNFRELLVIDDPHHKEVLDAVKKTSFEYQKGLVNQGLDDFE